ncbi:thioredoxin family protein [Paenibacillus alkalitolerans]|uniref:thioredoxin family protein n=1 Tax=Paenibacillus alkalitolerans TaxID=2799335 RepID=UPI0018F4DDD2|nr:thioredoxin family protein [Paenibacillus alkalitolerans]
MTLQTVNEEQYRTNINSPGVSVVEFGAVWCPPCKHLQPILENLADEYGASVSFAKIDVDECPEIAEEQAIMSMPTVIVYRDGQPVDKLVGLRPKAAYKTVIDRTLQG